MQLSAAPRQPCEQTLHDFTAGQLNHECTRQQPRQNAMLQTSVTGDGCAFADAWQRGIANFVRLQHYA